MATTKWKDCTIKKRWISMHQNCEISFTKFFFLKLMFNKSGTVPSTQKEVAPTPSLNIGKLTHCPFYTAWPLLSVYTSSASLQSITDKSACSCQVLSVAIMITFRVPLQEMCWQLYLAQSQYRGIIHHNCPSFCLGWSKDNAYMSIYTVASSCVNQFIY